jgi:hypothetical protein
VPFLAAVVVLALLLGAQEPRPPIVQSIDLSVPFTPVTSSEEFDEQLVYELHVTNFQPVDVTLRSVRVNVPSGTLAEYRDAGLHQRIVRPGLRHDHPTPQTIGPGMRAVIALWVPMTGTVAASVSHSVELDILRPSGAVRVTVDGGAAAITQQAAVILDPPLGGGHWVAIYDPLLKGGHRTAIYTIGGRARIPGRFAIDFIALPPMGAMAPKLVPRPAGLNGFGSDVLAVADATVAAALDDTADDLAPPVPPERGSGNYVSLDLGGGRFAFYEHLQQGSILVKPGQRVSRGQVIARLGSSGSTSIGPHLHFHVADANSLLGAEGLPFVFRQITGFGGFASIDALVNGERWLPDGSAHVYTLARPAPNTVISFR